MQNKPQPPKTNFPQMEEEMKKFWEDNKIFEKTLSKEAPKGDYVFYDGPPFATGTPHYGHIVANTLKDVMPRYKTMQGFHIDRKWGWDCHGLPVENLIEKELDLKTKEEIEKFGIDKFNDACEASVMRYADEWKKFIPRMGRWVDMENDYKTMNPEFMESIWWVFKKLYDKGLIYEGYKSMHLCPRCETTLSNFEVTQGYKDVKDLTVIAKFRIKNKESRFKNLDGDLYFLAWTTTPWTLPGNVALAVGSEIDYVVVKILEEKSNFYNNTYIIAKNIYDKWCDKEQIKKMWELYKTGSSISDGELERLFLCNSSKIVFNIKGKDLVGLEYEPLFNYFVEQTPPTPPARGGSAPRDLSDDEVRGSASKLEAEPLVEAKSDVVDTERGSTPSQGVEPLTALKGGENGWKIYAGDFVTTDEGTGIVHIAPAFGDDDMELGKKYNLPFIQHVKTNGRFVNEVRDFAGMEVKPKDDPSKTDIEIIKWLAHNGKLFHKEKYEHSYPHCWRCDTPLLNYATSSWFVRVTDLKEKLLKNNAKINWTPEHVKDGRFGKWLENARDWAISRSRFWGAPLPVWRCNNNVGAKNLSPDGCNHLKVIGSVSELEKLTGQKIPNLHKQFVDQLEIKCEKCGGVMKRIPEVLDCWFESGSMPYAQKHYLGEPLPDFDPETDKNFPADFIAEGIDQTRGWFYTLTVLATALFDKPAFKNVIVNGVVLAEDGQKMSKRLKNYPDPNELINKYGADAMRYYLMSSPVVKAGDLNFSEKGVNEVFQKVIMLLWNVYSFYETYQDQLSWNMEHETHNILDKWILAKLDLLIVEVTENLEIYDLQKASRPILEFINELSTWYLRRSRERFKFGDEDDKQSALQTMNHTLLTLSKLMAPFMPFMAESLYQKVSHSARETEFSAENSVSTNSVHLESWPTVESKVNSQMSNVITEMDLARKIVEAGLFERSKSQIKVRQILNSYTTSMVKAGELSEEIIEIIKDELNIKELKFGEDKLDTELTPELIQEGYAREIVRHINLMRKDLGLSINDTAEIFYSDNAELKNIFTKFGAEIMRDTLSFDSGVGNMDDIEIKKEMSIGENRIWVGLDS